MNMEPVKVPQHLELEDILVWGLGATDLVCLSSGALTAWWLYVAIPGPLILRAIAVLPFLVAGIALSLGRFGERSLRDWLITVIGYAARPRRRIYGGPG